MLWQLSILLVIGISVGCGRQRPLVSGRTPTPATRERTQPTKPNPIRDIKPIHTDDEFSIEPIGPGGVADAVTQEKLNALKLSLETKLHGHIQEASDSSTQWSGQIVAFGPRGEQDVLFSHDAQIAVRPASNMKLLVAWSRFVKEAAVRDTNSDSFQDLRYMMKESDNGMADSMFRALGGADSIEGLLDEHGIAKGNDLVIADGSGLSYSNQVSAETLIGILKMVRRSSHVSAFRGLLPVAGVDGTLAGRLGSAPGTVAAKTGSLPNGRVAALGGFADGRNGWQILFVLLCDGGRSFTAAKSAIDRIVVDTLEGLNTI